MLDRLQETANIIADKDELFKVLEGRQFKIDEPEVDKAREILLFYKSCTDLYTDIRQRRYETKQ